MAEEQAAQRGKGRPCKLTQELQDKICSYLKADNYFETTCWAVGITPKTGYNWLSRGEKENKGKFHDFYVAIMRADAEAEIVDIAFIKSGGFNWQSRAWIRERRSRQRWGRQQQTTQADNMAELAEQRAEEIRRALTDG